MSDLRVTLFGVVHTPDCPEAVVARWAWKGRNNLHGDVAHEQCLPDGLPKDNQPHEFSEEEKQRLRAMISLEP